MILKLLLNTQYKDIEEYYPNKKRKIFIVFDNMISDILSNDNS